MSIFQKSVLKNTSQDESKVAPPLKELMENVFIYIFCFVYALAWLILCYLTYQLIIFDNKENITSIAIIISAILASTAMAIVYIQNARHEQQKTKRELYDKRKDIVKKISDIFDCYIDREHKEAISQIEKIKGDFVLIELLFKPEDLELLRPLMNHFGRIVDLKKQIKRLISVFTYFQVKFLYTTWKLERNKIF